MTVPTVLRSGRFRVVTHLPPREHGPPHVHVWTARGEAIITLAAGGTVQAIREVTGMRARDVSEAFRLVEEHTAYLADRWRKIHG